MRHNIIAKMEDYINELKADRECRQLQILSDSLQKRFKIDEVTALTKGLDILDDLRTGGLVK